MPSLPRSPGDCQPRGSRPYHGSHPLVDCQLWGCGDSSLCGVAELRRYLSHGQPEPQYQIHLCFGEEYPTSTGRHLQKLIMAHVSTHRAADPRAHQWGDGDLWCPARTPSSQQLRAPQVEPVFARELFHHAQRLGPALLRGCPQPCAPTASGRIAHVLQQLCQP